MSLAIPIASTGLVVKIAFSCSNAACCSSPNLCFSFFCVNLFMGKATLVKCHELTRPHRRTVQYVLGRGRHPKNS